MRDEFLEPGAGSDLERAEEAGLRPRRLAEFVGQGELKEHLSIVLEAARRRGQATDHLLLAGPPGLGKTTLAGIVAAEMGVHLHVTSGPALERAGDLAAILTKLDDGDVLFVRRVDVRSIEQHGACVECCVNHGDGVIGGVRLGGQPHATEAERAHACGQSSALSGSNMPAC